MIKVQVWTPASQMSQTYKKAIHFMEGEMPSP